MQTKRKQQPKQKNARNNKQKSKPRKQNVRPVERGSAMGAQISTSSFTIASVGSGHIRVRGHEVLGPVVPQTPFSPSLAAVFDCNPACWKASRLSLTAAGYERYRYNSARIRYVPNVSTTVTGSTAVAIETDPDEQLPGGGDAVTRTLNSHFAGLTPVWQGMSIDFKRDPKDCEWYEASVLNTGSLKDVSQFLVYAVSDTPNQSSVTLGRLMIEYDIEFMYPELEYLDGGQQYTGASLLYLADGAAGSVATITTGTFDNLFQDVKYGVMRAVTNLPNMLISNSGLILAAGTAVYYGWSGNAWNLYATLEAARTLTNPLKLVGAASGVTFAALLRPLSKTSAPR